MPLISHIFLRAGRIKGDRHALQTLFNWEKSGSFPRRIVLPNRAICWLESEFRDWIDDRSRNGTSE